MDERSLAETVAAFRQSKADPIDHVRKLYDQVDSTEPTIEAWVTGPRDQTLVESDVNSLCERYPDPENRPPLFGIPVGIKDIIHVDGLQTRAGSSLPPEILSGPQASVVSALHDAGALVFGKTHTTEFAWMDPAPTRNPHDPAHTPGGSSSGSAAAVAAGTVPLALGTQTIGSVIRPASFCGVVGLKPSYGRIPVDGVIPLSPSVDHVGLFTQTVRDAHLASQVCVDEWDSTGRGHLLAQSTSDHSPTIGVPDGPYLEQTTKVGRFQFERALDELTEAGYLIERVQVLDDVDELNARHEALVATEAALTHHDWFEEYEAKYAQSTAELIRTGRSTDVQTVAVGRQSRRRLRSTLEDAMADLGIDVWVSPAAPGPAPKGIDSTGDPVMNLPWTHAGLPTLTVPAGNVNGLPVGLQCASSFGTDEYLLTWGQKIEETLSGL